jgi:hypothetical protein
MSETPKSGPQGRVDTKRRTLSKKASVVSKPRGSITTSNVKRGAATASATVSTVGHVACDNVVKGVDILDLFASEEDEASDFEGKGPRGCGVYKPESEHNESVEIFERNVPSAAG